MSYKELKNALGSERDLLKALNRMPASDVEYEV